MISTSRVKFFLVLLASLLVLGCVEDNTSNVEAGPDGEAPEASLAKAGSGDSGDTSLDTKALFPLLDRWQLPQVGQEVFNLEQTADDSECCTQIGQADECWMEDATDDGIICPTWDGAPSGYSLACLYGSCNADETLCACEDDDDCNDSVDRLGSCVIQPGDTVGQCGPSWCNGYKICSCWGGCVQATPVMPATVCDDADFDCCEGNYPQDPVFNTGGYVGNGYCADDPSCGGGCNSDADCDDSNVCTVDTCVIATGECSFSTDPAINDGNICTDDFCDPVTGITHANNSDPCNADDDGCTMDDVCFGGACTAGAVVNCNDGNPCTGPDECVNVPDGMWENTHTCSNPPLPDADASTYGWLDTLICEDRFCVGGILGPPIPVDCDGSDDICNDWECDPLGAEDNCTNNMLIGTSCDADGDLCTEDDSCEDGGGGTAVCTPGPAVVCPDTGTVCLTSTCNSSSGECDLSVNNGIACEEDADPCTIGTCGGGFCIEAPVDCSGLSDQCNNGVCEDDGFGGYTCVAQNVPNGTTCNADSSGCTYNDSCQTGVCTPGPAPTCNDSNVCTSDACQSTGINSYVCNYTNLPSTTTCNADGSGCTVGDHCNGSGACVTGTVVTPAACETALGVNTDCNTAHCQSTGATTYNCVADPFASVPLGGCNADNNGCTLDYCQDTGPTPGAECNTGALRNCSALNNLPCRTGVCVATSFYDSTCQPSNAPSTTACNFDSNGCTVGDHCTGTGSCMAGVPATCTPPDVCTTSACSSTSSTTYNCLNTSLPNCCLNNGDCASLSCPGVLPPAGCSAPVCNGATHLCECQNVAAGTACTNIDPALYPPNCYDGFCNSSGNCVATQHAAFNNLCSDLFVAPAGTNVNTSHDGYLGSFTNTGVATAGPDATVVANKLAITGSTLCAQNNYRSTGNYCTENDGVTRIGNGGRDLVYAFRYQTNTSSQHLLYSYVIKVEANYDTGLYVRTDIDDASDCPEGNNPTADYNPTINVVSEACHYPYDDGISPSYVPTVTEDDCSDSGNSFYGQECCDPCTEGGTCGYKWCERGYPDGCNMCGTGCTGIWEYPEDPFNCNSELPSGPGYSTYTYMASSIVSPQGATDGSWRTVFIYMDGVSSTTGNFYLTVERERWYASPCDRVNDDPRVYDVTHPGSGGSTYLGSLEGVVNSMHVGTGSTTCGGYDCWAGWSGATSCHGSGTENQFWPNQEHFKIHRTTAEGAGTYCVQTDESISGAADLSMSLWRRDPWGGPITICDQSYYNEGCRHNNSGGNIQWQINAAANELYMIEISNYAKITSPCTGNCNYSLTVTEGACPFTCASVLGESPTGSTPLNLSTYNGVWNYGTIGSGYVNNYHPSTGWSEGRDAVWAFTNNTGATRSVTVWYCSNDSTGFDGALGIYNCQNSQLAAVDSSGAGYSWGTGCEVITRNMANNEVWYVDADTYNGYYGSYILRLSY